MVLEAERRGALAPGGTVVEASAGNTGVGLALVCAVRGYRCVVVVPETTSRDKQSVLRALGATVEIARADVEADAPEGYIGRAAILARELGAFMPDQFENPANPGAHYTSTGPGDRRRLRGSPRRVRRGRRQRWHPRRHGALPARVRARRAHRGRHARAERLRRCARRHGGRGDHRGPGRLLAARGQARRGRDHRRSRRRRDDPASRARGGHPLRRVGGRGGVRRHPGRVPARPRGARGHAGARHRAQLPVHVLRRRVERAASMGLGA